MKKKVYPTPTSYKKVSMPAGAKFGAPSKNVEIAPDINPKPTREKKVALFKR